MLRAVLLGAVGVAIVLVVRGMPTICPAVMPPPASCHPEVRHGPALVALVVVLVLTVVAVVLAGAVREPHPALDALPTIALVLAVIVGAGATLVAGGFTIPPLLA